MPKDIKHYEILGLSLTAKCLILFNFPNKVFWFVGWVGCWFGWLANIDKNSNHCSTLLRLPTGTELFKICQTYQKENNHTKGFHRKHENAC